MVDTLGVTYVYNIRNVILSDGMNLITKPQLINYLLLSLQNELCHDENIIHFQRFFNEMENVFDSNL